MPFYNASLPTLVCVCLPTETIEVFGNRLNGPIPTEFGNIVQLETLSLQNNRLTGPIPSELGRLTNVREYQKTTNSYPHDVFCCVLSNAFDVRLDNVVSYTSTTSDHSLASYHSLFLPLAQMHTHTQTHIFTAHRRNACVGHQPTDGCHTDRTMCHDRV